MAPSVSRASQRLNQLEDEVLKWRERSNQNREAAWAAYERAVRRDNRVQAAAEENLRRIDKKNGELNILLGSMRGTDPADVKDILKPVEFEMVDESEEEMYEQGGNQLEQKGPRVAPSSTLGALKKGRAVRKPAKMTKAPGMFGGKERAAARAKAQPKPASDDESSGEASSRTRQQRSQSTLSEIVVASREQTSLQDCSQTGATEELEKSAHDQTAFSLARPQGEHQLDDPQLSSLPEPTWSFPDGSLASTVPEAHEDVESLRSGSFLRSRSSTTSSSGSSLFVRERRNRVPSIESKIETSVEMDVQSHISAFSSEIDKLLAPAQQTPEVKVAYASSRGPSPPPATPSLRPQGFGKEKPANIHLDEPFTWTPEPGMVFPYSPRVYLVDEGESERPARSSSNSSGLFVSMERTPTPPPPPKRRRTRKSTTSRQSMFDLGAAIAMGAMAKYQK